MDLTEGRVRTVLSYGFFERRLNPIVSSNVVAVIGNGAVLIYDTGIIRVEAGG